MRMKNMLQKIKLRNKLSKYKFTPEPSKQNLHVKFGNILLSIRNPELDMVKHTNVTNVTNVTPDQLDVKFEHGLLTKVTQEHLHVKFGDVTNVTNVTNVTPDQLHANQGMLTCDETSTTKWDEATNIPLPPSPPPKRRRREDTYVTTYQQNVTPDETHAEEDTNNVNEEEEEDDPRKPHDVTQPMKIVEGDEDNQLDVVNDEDALHRTPPKIRKTEMNTNMNVKRDNIARVEI